VISDSSTRQYQRDAEYLAACRAHGIKPELPKYRAAGKAEELADLDRYAVEQDGAHKNGHGYQVARAEPIPLEQLTPEAEAAGKVIDLLVPLKGGATEFVRTAGRRALCLAWLLGRRPEPLADLARQLGISRASLSTHVRRIEDLTGLHGRGQKGATTRATYAATARQGWKLRRLNKVLAAAVTE